MADSRQSSTSQGPVVRDVTVSHGTAASQTFRVSVPDIATSCECAKLYDCPSLSWQAATLP